MLKTNLYYNKKIKIKKKMFRQITWYILYKFTESKLLFYCKLLPNISFLIIIIIITNYFANIYSIYEICVF